jgi:hypothetical protein
VPTCHRPNHRRLGPLTLVSYYLLLGSAPTSNYPSVKYKSDAWHRKVFHPLLVECHTLWTLYNGECHGTGKQTQQTKRLEQLKRGLIAIYKYESEVLASDKDIFDTPITGLLILPPAEIGKWIVSRCPIIPSSSKAVARPDAACFLRTPILFAARKRNAPPDQNPHNHHPTLSQLRSSLRSSVVP